ncbi:MAG TPA: hypothetical protein PKH48_06805 [Methanofastidiosum sp.]|jgi:hypothetical protein|nr:hypothetical protein [Methanofastidiosum sp.]
MNLYLLANIGNSDVYLDSEEIVKPRIKGKDILLNIEEYKKRISFPIISKIFEDYSFEKVFLFATRQNKDLIDQKFWEKDTIYLAEIIKSHFNNVEYEIISNNPSDYTDMYKFFADKLPKIKEKIPSDSLVFLLLSGGVPAQNTSLLLTGVKVFGSNSQPIYVNPTGRIDVLEINKILSKERSIDDAVTAINNYDYFSAIVILKLIDGDPYIINFLEYLDRRVNFDFKRAKNIILTINASGQDKLYLDNLLNYLISLEAGSDEKKILELYYHICIAYKKSEYLEFLAYLFRFHEGYLYHLFERETGKKIIDFKKESEFKKFISDPSVKNYLSRQIHNGERLKYWVFSRPVAMNIIKYFIEVEGKKQLYGEYERLKFIEGLADIRNKTIFGHGYEGVSKEDILKKYQEIKKNYYEERYGKDMPVGEYETKVDKPSRRDIFMDLNFLISKIAPIDNEFDELNNYIIPKIRRLR